MRDKYACRTGKLKYSSRVEAELAVEAINPFPVQYPYKCKHCKGWHLSKQDPVTRTVNGLTRTQKRRQVRKRQKARRRGELLDD